MSKAITTKISATSRVALRIKDNYYTIEFTEERAVPEDCNLEEERTALWDAVNGSVDEQCEQILKTFR